MLHIETSEKVLGPSAQNEAYIPQLTTSFLYSYHFNPDSIKFSHLQLFLAEKTLLANGLSFVLFLASRQPRIQT